MGASKKLIYNIFSQMLHRLKNQHKYKYECKYKYKYKYKVFPVDAPEAQKPGQPLNVTVDAVSGGWVIR